MARQYEALRDGRITGPYRSHELKAMIAANQLSGQDRIRMVGEDTWFRIDTIEKLRPHLAPISPPPVPPPPIPPPPIPPPPPTGWSSVRDLQHREVMSPVAEQPYYSTPPYPGVELRSETDKQPRSDLSRSVTSVVAVGFGLLGVADFALFNLGLWDFYAAFGIAGTFIERFTPIIAFVIMSTLFSVATKTSDQAVAARWIASGVGTLFLLATVVSSVLASTLTVEWAVRGGSLEFCPEHTVNEIANAFLKDPEWEAIEGLDGNRYVNLTGGLQYSGRPASILMQFIVVGDEFDLNATEIDGSPVPNLIGLQVLQAACEEAG